MNTMHTGLSVFLRSFFLQGLWNFEGLQNVGFAYGLYPFLVRLYPDPAVRRIVLLRHLGFFNTHPYMVSIVFGMIASMEEDIAAAPQSSPEAISVLKNNMAGPLAAIGDTFFWATWRPFVALITITLILLFHKFNNYYGAWFAPLTFVVIYNSIHIPFRYWSLSLSYQLRLKIVEIIAGLKFQYLVDILRFFGVVVVLLMLVFYFWAFADGFGDVAIFTLILGGAFVAGCFKISSISIFYGIIAVSIIIAYL